MSSAQFAMVEELASLVKDNLPSKHLLLSVEEMFVNFLEDHTSLDGVLVLKPMNPYNRLLVHRLSEIFGFSHQSVGEGEERHLVLERCPETSMPPILVNDFLQFDDMQSPMIIEEPRQKVIMPGQRNNAGSKSLEERESSYFAARERIFSADASEEKPIKERPKHDPVVARRMITHALGQSISNQAMKHEPSSSDTKDNAQATKGLKTQYVNKRVVNSPSDEHLGPCTTSNVEGFSRSSKPTNSTSKGPQTKNDLTQAKGGEENYLRKEHMGAAKRLFANALGMHPRDLNLSKCDETKKSSPRVTDGCS